MHRVRVGAVSQYRPERAGTVRDVRDGGHCVFDCQHFPGRQRQPRDLYGIWKDGFPKDFDIDAALREIRGEWQKEVEEIIQ